MQTNLARILLFLAFVAVGAAAQEGDVDAAAAEQAAEIEALEPGVSSATLEEAGAAETDTATESAAAEPAAVVAQDIRRRQSSSGVMDEIDLERTEITGNQELPKVLYIVPWQKSQPGELSGKPVNSLLDEVLAPIDRSEFIRQVDYYGDLYAEEE